MRLIAAVATVAIAAASGAALGAVGSGSTHPLCPGATEHPDGWTRVSPPRTFTSAIVDLAVPAQRRGVFYVTDGTIVSRTSDDGCSFHDVYTAPAEPLTADPQVRQQLGLRGVAFFTQLAVAPGTGSRVIALLETRVPQASAPEQHQTLVATSPTGDSGSWSPINAPLPGAPGKVVLANNSVGYLTVHTPNANTEDVYATTDGGNTWTPGARGLAATDLTADPGQPASVYAWGSGGLLHSGDSGQTFTTVDGPTGPTNAAQVYDTAGGPELIAFNQSAYAFYLRPGGFTFQPFPAVQGVNGVDRTLGLGFAARNPYIAYTAQGIGFLQAVDGSGACGPILATPSATGPVRHAQTAAPGKLYLTDGSAVYRSVLETVGRCPSVRVPPLPTRPPIDLSVPGKHDVRQASISPASRSVRLRPGQSADLTYGVDLPATPTPLDVMFLVDTTQSMSPTINGIRVGIGQIVRDLARSGIDVAFGLGDFQDYPIQPYGCTAPSTNANCQVSDHAYRRDLPISPVGEPLRNAINELTLGDGGDPPEATLTAVDQATTGLGVAKVAGVPSAGYWVAPGQPAQWRDGSLRVLVVATDNGFHDSLSKPSGPCTDPVQIREGCGAGAGYPGPSFPDTIAHLNSANIKVVGLDVSGIEDGPASRDEGRLASGTATTVPAGGVDCGSTDYPRLKVGAPLVCPVDTGAETLNLAPVIVALLKALRDLTPLTLTATEHGRPVPVKHPYAVVSPTVFPSVDVKAENQLPFRVHLSCPTGPDSEHTISLAATVRRQIVATGVVQLACQAVEPRPVVVPPVAPLLPALVVPIIPPPAPVQPPPANPNPNPNPNPAPGAAAEEQKEPQLAVAGADQVAGPDDETSLDLAMSDHRKQGYDIGTLLMWVGLVSACAGAGLVLRHRQQEATRASFTAARI